MPIDHWMMFGTFAEQDHFAYPKKEVYRGVIINGNMAAHAPEGLAAFLIEKTANHTYLVDPLTHAFQHDPNYITDKEGDPKSSIQAIAQAYGSPVLETVGKRPIRPKDLTPDSVLSDFVQRCVDFQSKKLADVMASSDSRKYLRVDDKALRPYAIVAPYFFMTEVTCDAWLPLCIRAAQMARKAVQGSKVFGSVVVSKGVVADEAIRERIGNEFGNVALDGFLIWVDDLNELEASRRELSGLIDLARRLRAGGKREVINLHGGYFSVLAAGILGNGAMTGVTHGPEFGEYRSVVPVGGGIPIARYYVPQIHARVKYRDAVRLFRDKGLLKSAEGFFSRVCDCSECRKTIGDDIANFTKFGESQTRNVRRGASVVRIDFPKTETKLRCLRHYLHRKYLEFQFAATASKNQILSNLDEGKSQFEEHMGLDGIAHLDLWKKTLLET